MIKALTLVAVAVFLLLQFRYWFGDSGVATQTNLEQTIAVQQARGRLLVERNTLLKAEVLALRDGRGAVEARARSQLGMIMEGETFFMTDQHPSEPQADLQMNLRTTTE